MDCALPQMAVRPLRKFPRRVAAFAVALAPSGRADLPLRPRGRRFRRRGRRRAARSASQQLAAFRSATVDDRSAEQRPEIPLVHGHRRASCASTSLPLQLFRRPARRLLAGRREDPLRQISPRCSTTAAAPPTRWGGCCCISSAARRRRTSPLRTRSARRCSSSISGRMWRSITRKGRIYLPQDEMQRYGVTERHIARAPLRRRVARVDRLPGRARAGDAPVAARRWDARCPGASASRSARPSQGGLRILEKLERAGGDMFRHRPVLKWFDWPLLLLRASAS